MSLHSRFEVLDLDGQGHDEVENDPSIFEESPRSGQPVPHIMTISMKKKWQVIIGNSLLRRTVGLTADQTHLLGKFAASLRLGLKMLPGDFLAWYRPKIIIHYWFLM